MSDLTFVPHTNWVDKTSGAVIKTKELPCLTDKGKPNTGTVGSVGCLYMDTDSGTVYKCTAAADGVCTWSAVIDESEIQAIVDAYLEENPPSSDSGQSATYNPETGELVIDDASYDEATGELTI